MLPVDIVHVPLPPLKSLSTPSYRAGMRGGFALGNVVPCRVRASRR